jgi:hypothetical protein
MAAWQWQLLAAWVIVTCLVLLRAGGALRRVPGSWFSDPPEPDASDQEIIATQHLLETDYAAIRADRAAAVDVLYTEAKGGYDLARERNKVLEGKAGTLITIVTTGFGAIALIGDPSKGVQRNGAVIVALTSLAMAFFAALGALVPRRTDYPLLAQYASAEILAKNDNAARIKFDLIGSWLQGQRRNNAAARDKGRLLFGATLLLGLGLGALAYNFSTVERPASLTPTIRVILSPEPSPSPSAKPGGTARKPVPPHPKASR